MPLKHLEMRSDFEIGNLHAHSASYEEPIICGLFADLKEISKKWESKKMVTLQNLIAQRRDWLADYQENGSGSKLVNELIGSYFLEGLGEETGGVKFKRFGLIWVAALIVIGSAQMCIGQTVYEIEGTVYGPDAKPIANVSISLQNHAGAQVDQDITKSDGRYRFSGVVAGTYYVSVKPPETGIQPVVQRIELINSGISVSNFSKERLDFSLKRVASAPPIVGTIFAQAIPPDAEKVYVSAVSSISKGDKDAAVGNLKKAIEIFPTYFLALQQLGLLYVDVEKDEQAIAPLKKAIEVNPKAAVSHLGLGMAYVNLDRLKEAVPELNTAISLDSRLFRAHLFLGMAFITMGKLDEAEKLLKEAYSIGGPKQASAAHLYLTSIYNSRKDYKKAISELEAYLKENPKAPNAQKIQEAITKLKAKL